MKRLCLSCALVILIAASSTFAQEPPPPTPFEPDLEESEMVKLPKGVLLVKGTEASASDSVTPLPESGRVVKDVYQNPYFGFSYPLPAEWSENHSGPPPSDTGTYVLSLLGPSPKYKGESRATLLIQAYDLFFSPLAVETAAELARHGKDALEPYYKVERNPEPVKIAKRAFTRFDYKSEVAGLHWVVLTTEIRCHAVQFVFTSSDMDLLERLIKDMERLQFSTEATPVCIAGYGDGANVTNRVAPVMTGSKKFNPIPVRVIIDTRGRIRHIHLINAFADQAASITDALNQWTFKPHERNGERVEVETGLLFGYAYPWPKQAKSSAPAASDE
jgi:hypothetical protein